MKSKNALAKLTVLIGLFTFAGTAKAVVPVEVVLRVDFPSSRTGQLDRYYWGIQSYGSCSWTLTQLLVEMATRDPGYNPSLETFTLSLYNNNGFGSPGSLIAGGIVGTSRSSVTSYNMGYIWEESFYLDGLNITLTPSQSFFYTIQSTDYNSDSWLSSSTNSSLGWASLGGQVKIAGNYYSAGSDVPTGYLFAYATTGVPEPSTYAAIFGTVILGFAAYKRRRAG